MEYSAERELLERLQAAKDEIRRCEDLIEKEREAKKSRSVSEGWFITEFDKGIRLCRYIKGSDKDFYVVVTITEDGAQLMPFAEAALDGIAIGARGTIALR